MFASLRRSKPVLDEVVDDLPAGWHALDWGTGRAVIGPTGAFALTDAGVDVEHAAEQVVRSAAELRDVIARRLSWAPFVDPLVVVDDGIGRAGAAAVVPRRHLFDVLTGGHHQLADEQVDRIVATIADL